MLCDLRYHLARALVFLLAITYFGLHLNNELGTEAVGDPTYQDDFIAWFVTIWNEIGGDFSDENIIRAQLSVPVYFRGHIRAALKALESMHANTNNQNFIMSVTERKRFAKLYDKIKNALGMSDSLNEYFYAINLRYIPTSLIQLWRKIEERQLLSGSTEPCSDETLNLKIPQSNDGPDICFSMEILEKEAEALMFPTELLVSMTSLLTTLDTDDDYRQNSGLNFANFYYVLKHSAESRPQGRILKKMIHRIVTKMLPKLLHEVFIRTYQEIREYASNINDAAKMHTFYQTVTSVAQEKNYPEDLLTIAAQEIITLKPHSPNFNVRKQSLAKRNYYTNFLWLEICDAPPKDPLRYEIDTAWAVDLHLALDRLWQNVDNLNNYKIDYFNIASVAQNSPVPIYLIESKVKDIQLTIYQLSQANNNLNHDLNDALSTHIFLREQLMIPPHEHCRVDPLFFQIALPSLEQPAMMERVVNYPESVQSQADRTLQHNQNFPTSLNATGFGFRVPEVGESPHARSLDFASSSASAPWNEELGSYSHNLHQDMFDTSPQFMQQDFPSQNRFDIPHPIPEWCQQTLSDFSLNDDAPSTSRNRQANRLPQLPRHDESTTTDQTDEYAIFADLEEL